MKWRRRQTWAVRGGLRSTIHDIGRNLGTHIILIFLVLCFNFSVSFELLTCVTSLAFPPSNFAEIYLLHAPRTKYHMTRVVIEQLSCHFLIHEPGLLAQAWILVLTEHHSMPTCREVANSTVTVHGFSRYPAVLRSIHVLSQPACWYLGLRRLVLFSWGGWLAIT